ncbi:MAG TPA: DUF4915 domain-containing protein, partial [Solirubrobacteraceae bacterium]|nr:DUF4915 domain-containing protein [Solirubrobacteraceae bacterium]
MSSALGETSPVLLVSAFGDEVTSGGLFALDGSRADRIDRVSSTGLTYDGRSLARNLLAHAHDAIVGEIVVYDEGGVRRYLRVDEAAAVHDIAWDGDDVAVVSTWHNAVRWFSPSGAKVRDVRYPGPRDAWHVNCITRRDGEWFATVFGGFRMFRGWSFAADGNGRIVNLMTGTTVVRGLTRPHTPRWFDGAWLVCNSLKNEVLAVDEASGRVVRRVNCDHWTRGLAWDDAFLYVGACQRRRTRDPAGQSHVVVIDRQTWRIVDRIPVPAQELYDLVFVPRTLLPGLRRGFDVNPLRASESRQYALLDRLGV